MAYGVRDAFAYQYGRGRRASQGSLRENRRIGHTEPGDAVEPAVLVDDCSGVVGRSHRCGAAGVVSGSEVACDPRVQGTVVDEWSGVGTEESTGDLTEGAGGGQLRCGTDDFMQEAPVLRGPRAAAVVNARGRRWGRLTEGADCRCAGIDELAEFAAIRAGR